MPIIKSAIKRVRSTQRRTERNEIVKKKLKTTLKQFQALVTAKKLAEAAQMFATVQKVIDTAVKKNIWAKNQGARKKSRLSKLIKAEAAPKKAAVKAPAAPKAKVAKAAAPKKPAAKKKAE